MFLGHRKAVRPAGIGFREIPPRLRLRGFRRLCTGFFLRNLKQKLERNPAARTAGQARRHAMPGKNLDDVLAIFGLDELLGPGVHADVELHIGGKDALIRVAGTQAGQHELVNLVG